MATETKPAASEDAKIDLFEDDDEFEEFEIDQGETFFLFFFTSQLLDYRLGFFFFLVKFINIRLGFV